MGAAASLGAGRSVRRLVPAGTFLPQLPVATLSEWSGLLGLAAALVLSLTWRKAGSSFFRLFTPMLLAVLRGLCHSGELNRVSDYLDTISAWTQPPEGDYTIQPVVNIILTDFLRRCRELDIRASVRVELPPHLPVPDADLCALLTNLLENAIEANKKIPEGVERWLRVAIHIRGQYLYIGVENARFHPVRRSGEQDLPHSDKPGAGHGLGLRSARSTARKYNSELRLKAPPGSFSASTALLPEESDSAPSLSAAALLRDRQVDASIIYITDHPAYALDSFPTYPPGVSGQAGGRGPAGRGAELGQAPAWQIQAHAPKHQQRLHSLGGHPLSGDLRPQDRRPHHPGEPAAVRPPVQAGRAFARPGLLPQPFQLSGKPVPRPAGGPRLPHPGQRRDDPCQPPVLSELDERLHRLSEAVKPVRRRKKPLRAPASKVIE